MLPLDADVLAEQVGQVRALQQQAADLLLKRHQVGWAARRVRGGVGGDLAEEVAAAPLRVLIAVAVERGVRRRTLLPLPLLRRRRGGREDQVHQIRALVGVTKADVARQEVGPGGATLPGALVTEESLAMRRQTLADARRHFRGHHEVGHLLREVLALRPTTVEAVRVLARHGRVHVEEAIVPHHDGAAERAPT